MCFVNTYRGGQEKMAGESAKIPERRLSSPPQVVHQRHMPVGTQKFHIPRKTKEKLGVSVCLRFMTDFRNFVVFKLSPRSPLTFTWNNPYYDLRWFYFSDVSLNPRIFLWNSVHSQPWTSVCLVLDSRKNVAQVFQGGAMSIRKILRSRMVWSGEPVVDLSGFDGQVTDLEVWDYPLQYREVLAYMQNYGSSGTVLTWSNIAYKYRGNILVEDTYSPRMAKSIGSRDGHQQPIRSRWGRDKQLKHEKKRRTNRFQNVL